ncbi:hypothetical protein KI387_036478, partial [Taxus chinensis]
DRKVEYGGHRVIINEKLIAKEIGLDLEGYHFFNKRIDRTVEDEKFSEEGKEVEFTFVGVR